MTQTFQHYSSEMSKHKPYTQFSITFLPISHDTVNWKPFQLVRFLCNFQNKPKGLLWPCNCYFVFINSSTFAIPSLEEFLRQVHFRQFLNHIGFTAQLCHFLIPLHFTQVRKYICVCIMFLKGKKYSPKLYSKIQSKT